MKIGSNPWLGSGALRSALALPCFAVWVTGCASLGASDTHLPPGGQATRAVGLPNPATVTCSRAGGTPAIERGPDGAERGVCRWPSGLVCDQWAFFRGECGTPQVDRRPGS